jgi:hypothetical protein
MNERQSIVIAIATIPTSYDVDAQVSGPSFLYQALLRDLISPGPIPPTATEGTNYPEILSALHLR